MAIFSGLEIGLGFVCGCVFLGFVAELYYLLWWKKRRVAIENQSLSLSSSSCSSNYTPTHLSTYISCWKNPNSSKPTKTLESKQDPEMGLEEEVILKGVDEESADLELMRLHNLQGPPRFLTTINEETKEELESQRSRKGSRTRSLSDLFVVHMDSPQDSPPLKGLHELKNLEGFHHHGLNPLFESEIKKMKSSPPPTFKFLRDAEEKLLRRLMKLEEEKRVDSCVKMEEKDGFSVKLVDFKAKNGVSGPSKVIPLVSSPSNNQSN